MITSLHVFGYAFMAAIGWYIGHALVQTAINFANFKLIARYQRESLKAAMANLPKSSGIVVMTPVPSVPKEKLN